MFVRQFLPIGLLQDALQVREGFAVFYSRQPVMTDNTIHLFLGLSKHIRVQNHDQDEAVHNAFRLVHGQDKKYPYQLRGAQFLYPLEMIQK